MVLTRVVHQVGVAIAVCVGRVLQRHARGPTRCCQPESEPRESMSPTIRNFAFTLVTVALVAGCANRSDSALMPPPDDSWSPAINASATGGGLPPPSAAPAAPAPRDPWPRDVTLSQCRCADLPAADRVVDRQHARVARCGGVATDRPEGETFGVVWGTARTDVDRVTRTVELERPVVSEDQLPDAVRQGCAVPVRACAPRSRTRCRRWRSTASRRRSRPRRP